jgi:hypothetical protein
MSTEIAKIKGRKESGVLPGVPVYIDSTLYLTRFSGGKENGRMLQLTIWNDQEGGSYTQLTEDQVKELSKTLSEAFDDNIYPSE